MPADDVASRVRHVADLSALVRAKKRWGVSEAALCYRLHRLGIATDWQNRGLNIEISSRDYRRKEPDGLPPKVSALWPQIFSALWGEQVAAELHLPLSELDAVLFGLNGGVSPSSASPSVLKAVTVSDRSA